MAVIYHTVAFFLCPGGRHPHDKPLLARRSSITLCNPAVFATAPTPNCSPQSRKANGASPPTEGEPTAAPRRTFAPISSRFACQAMPRGGAVSNNFDLGCARCPPQRPFLPASKFLWQPTRPAPPLQRKPDMTQTVDAGPCRITKTEDLVLASGFEDLRRPLALRKRQHQSQKCW